MEEKKLLTKSEFQVMRALWSLPEGDAYTGQILEQHALPKPAYTTLATFLKILTRKGFITSRKIGNMLFYNPLVSQQEYALMYMRHTAECLFDNDTKKMMDFIRKNMND